MAARLRRFMRFPQSGERKCLPVSFAGYGCLGSADRRRVWPAADRQRREILVCRRYASGSGRLPKVVNPGRPVELAIVQAVRPIADTAAFCPDAASKSVFLLPVAVRR